MQVTAGKRFLSGTTGGQVPRSFAGKCEKDFETAQGPPRVPGRRGESAMGWEQVGVVVGVISPLVGMPLGIIALYLRAIREQQAVTTSEIARRIHTIEGSLEHLVRRTAEFDREFATKEEWLRESMLARQRLERLTELVTRIEAELDGERGLAAEIGRATTAMVELVRRLAGAADAASVEGNGPPGRPLPCWRREDQSEAEGVTDGQIP